MVKPSPPFRIDERVFLTMAIVAAFAGIVLAFRYKNYEPCQPIKFSVNAIRYFDGFPISFRATVKDGSKFEWNFGDDNGNVFKEYSSPSTTHIYERPGQYIVTVRVNGRCEETETVSISQMPVIKNPDLVPQFTGPVSAVVNEQVTFTDNTPGAHKWEWRFEETGTVEGNSRTASHVYKTPGNKNIYLRINGRPDMFALRTLLVTDPKANYRNASLPKGGSRLTGGGAAGRIIYIPAKPEHPPLGSDMPAENTRPPTSTAGSDPAPANLKKGPNLTAAQVEAFLYEVADNKKSARDFSANLCDNLKVPVRYNKKLITFAEMCSKIEEIKRRRIKKILVLGLIQDNGCITDMAVTLDKTLF